jgi:tripartite-type tricarboxylate transporter receptor subunit TctC
MAATSAAIPPCAIQAFMRCDSHVHIVGPVETCPQAPQPGAALWIPIAMTRLLLTLWLACAGWSCARAQAPDAKWPERPVRFIVPFPAGSTTDLVARVVTQKLAERLGQPVVIEDRAGASGNLGTEALARAAPDGYTIGMATSSTHVIPTALNVKLNYDPLTDFAPVSMLVDTPYALVVYPGLPAKDVAELIALAKARPRALNVSSVGPTSLAYLAGALFSNMAGVALTHVPYRSSSQAVVDLNEGRIEVQFGTLAASLPFVREAKLRALAVTSTRRWPALPDVPTLSEAGLPGYEATLWMGLVMPARSPPAIIARLNREIATVLAAPEVKEALAAQAVEVTPGTPEELREHIRRDIEKWRALAAATGIHVE